MACFRNGTNAKRNLAQYANGNRESAAGHPPGIDVRTPFFTNCSKKPLG